MGIKNVNILFASTISTFQVRNWHRKVQEKDSNSLSLQCNNKSLQPNASRQCNHCYLFHLTFLKRIGVYCDDKNNNCLMKIMKHGIKYLNMERWSFTTLTHMSWENKFHKVCWCEFRKDRQCTSKMILVIYTDAFICLTWKSHISSFSFVQNTVHYPQFLLILV